MGYTHYWKFSKAPKGDAAKVEKAYKAALVECSRVIHAYQAFCAENGLDAERLSGYSAHAKPGAYGGLNVNGKGDLSHENLTMREHFSENDGFGFCKTARKPYDVVVTACLAVLAYRLPGLIAVSSDGRAKDWETGVKLARTVLKRKIPNPLETKQKAA
jgi:hypothetical protein